MADHDARCERVVVGERTSGGGRPFKVGFLICHCARRARLATGLVDLPTEDLEWLPPDCPHCGRGVDFDGDRLWCEQCHLTWDSRGSGPSAHFVDEYAPTDGALAVQARDWLANYRTTHPEGAPL